MNKNTFKNLESGENGVERVEREMNNNHINDSNLETDNVLDSFLHDALGSTLSLTGENYETCHHSESHIISPCELFEKRKEHIREQIYHTVHGYRVMIQENKIKARSPLLCTTFKVNFKELQMAEEDKGKIVKTLEQNILSERIILEQTTKALKFCCSSEYFCLSSQRAEWERQLLLSIHRYKEMVKKHKFLKENSGNECSVQYECGKVEISNLYLYLNRPPLFQNEKFDTWIIFLLSHDDNIKATQVYLAPKDQKQLQVNESFTFNNLLNDFRINIQVFTLKLKNSKTRKQKFHFKKCDNGNSCIPDLSLHDEFRVPDFYLEGLFDLKLENLSSFLLFEFTPGAQIKFHLKWDVKSKLKISGFLSMQKNSGDYKIWERKWCLLEESSLKYWNYPSDEDQLPPLGSLDLKQCMTSKVQPLEPDLDPRQKTFVLEIGQVSQNSNLFADLKPPATKLITHKYIFRADSTRELNEWCMVLSKHIELLSKWNLMKTTQQILD